MHPWQLNMDARKKLAEARKIAARRRERKSHKDDKHGKLIMRNRARIKSGIPIELPAMKPWDYAKGKVHNTELSDRRPLTYENQEPQEKTDSAARRFAEAGWFGLV
jgi:hypothetical protein